jgi:hypothetical protein
MRDLIVRVEGSICLLVPVTPAGQDWCDEHLPADAMKWGKAIVVEPRYISDIIDGAADDGLEV